MPFFSLIILTLLLPWVICSSVTAMFKTFVSGLTLSEAEYLKGFQDHCCFE